MTAPQPKPRVPLAVVGLGKFGRMMLDQQIARGEGAEWFRLAGVCDAEAGRAASAASRYGVTAYDRLDALLDDPAVPAVALFTGPVGRADLVRRIARAGKDVITTKPFERDPAAALRVLHECRDLGRVVHLNSPGPRPSPDLDQIAAWHREFDLGRIVAARAEAWADYRETPDGSWYDDPDACPAAPIFRIGIYLINDLIRLMGSPQSLQVASSRLRTARPTADHASMTLRFPGGELATVFASFCVGDGQSWRNALTLHFERGTVYRNVGPATVPDARRTPELELVATHAGAQITRRAVAPGSSEDYPWAQFHRAVTTRHRDGETTPEQVAAGLRVIDAMRRAELSGATETL